MAKNIIRSDSYYPEGLRKWDEKNFPQTSSTPNAANLQQTPDSVIANNINSCNIKTDIIDVSLKVENDAGELLFHTFTREIMSWDVNDSVLTINTEDEVSTVFTLLSPEDAIIGSNRVDKIVNGQDVQLCDDINDTVFYAIIEETVPFNSPFIVTEINSYMIEE